MRLFLSLFFALILCIAGAGCTAAPPEPTYTVSDDGRLSLDVPAPECSEGAIQTAGDVTVSRLVLHRDIDVACLLAAPPSPRAAIVYAPGAGVKKEAHLERAIRYAEAGIAFLVVDVRGNGGETPGRAFDLAADFAAFEEGAWPQTYAIAADLVAAEQVLVKRYGVPVWAMGSSNGGRYAEYAAAADPAFAGYIGVSTSGFGVAAEDYEGDARRFLLSIDPAASVASISPRTVLIFHAQGDRIIPFEDGRALFEAAAEPKEFFSFNGTHGVNGEVDERVMALCV
jgi:fermentation-respiration switch protein FrsA (DUF1100 family)